MPQIGDGHSNKKSVCVIRNRGVIIEPISKRITYLESWENSLPFWYNTLWNRARNKNFSILRKIIFNHFWRGGRGHPAFLNGGYTFLGTCRVACKIFRSPTRCKPGEKAFVASKDFHARNLACRAFPGGRAFSILANYFSGLLGARFGANCDTVG